MTQTKLTTFSLVMLFYCLLVTDVRAQFVSVPSSFNTPYGKVTTYSQVYMPMRFGYNTVVNRKHNFTIVLQNDSTIEAKTRINIDDSIHFLSWGKKDNKTVVKPADTKEIYRYEGEQKITGIPMDSCWIFLAEIGKINTYSITSDIDEPIVGFVQKGEASPIVAMTQENLEEMVKDNEKALTLVRKKKLLKAVRKYNDQ